MTSFWPEGLVITVEVTEEGVPRRLQWMAEWHLVKGVAQRWRIDASWWKKRVWRDYFKVYTDSGMLLVIFLDLQTGRWYVQRLYD